MDLYKNPEFEPQDEKYEDRQKDAHDFPTEIAGPGGRTTNIENNERGILDAIVFRAIGTETEAPLMSEHSGHRMGIYTTNHEGSNY
jgi:hypothetical protein